MPGFPSTNSSFVSFSNVFCFFFCNIASLELLSPLKKLDQRSGSINRTRTYSAQQFGLPIKWDLNQKWQRNPRQEIATALFQLLSPIDTKLHKTEPHKTHEARTRTVPSTRSSTKQTEGLSVRMVMMVHIFLAIVVRIWPSIFGTARCCGCCCWRVQLTFESI